jgi:sugar lactone lactonase YvrE
MGMARISRNALSQIGRMLRHPFMYSCALGVASLATAAAQSPTLLQIPTMTAVAGLPAGGSVTAVCSAAYTSVGDGCPAAQAKLGTVLSSVIDSNGNIYIADETNKELRVIYQSGTALSAAIIAANASYKVTTVQAGYMYLLVGAGAFTGNSSTGEVGDETLLSAPVSVALDSEGNVFFGDNASRLRAFFVSDASGKFSTLLNGVWGNPSPALTFKAGSEYVVIEPSTGGYSGDGLAPALAASAAETNVQHGIVLDASENLYIADTSNNAIRRVSGSTGLLSTYIGSTGCVEGTKASCTAGDAGNSGPINQAETDLPYALALDANGNLYIGEEGSGEVRAIYNGSGSLPGISNPQTGYIYRIAGGGTLTVSGTTALSVKFTVSSGATTNYSAFGLGFDAAGNLYVEDRTGRLWEIDASTQIATIIGGSPLTSTGGQTETTTGAACSASNIGGSKTTDNFGDGCPATQGVLGLPGQNIQFDAQGNIYVLDGTYDVLHKLSFKPVFPQTATGSTSAVQTLLFSSLAAQTLGTMSYGVQGATTTDFQAAGGSTCTAGTVLAIGSTCLVNLDFAPVLPGARNGFLQAMNSSGGLIGDFYLSGTATGAELTVDPGAQTSVGSKLSARGVAVDPAGDVFVADGTTESLLAYAGGSSTATSLSTGLSSPGQVAIDDLGDVFVADAGNNRIAEYSKIKQATTYLTESFSSPQGVAIDSAGDIYVADTGNNRIVEIYSTGVTRVLTTSVLSPTRLSFDASDNLYILDSGNSRVVEIPSATDTQVTVSTSGFTPVDMAVDAAGNVYVLDSGGLQVGVSTTAGSTYTILSSLTAPTALALDDLGDVYVADTGVTSLVVLNRQLDTINFGYASPGSSSVGETFTLTDIGNVAVSFTNSAIAITTGDAADFSTVAGVSNGCSSQTLDVASQCTLTTTFSPLVDQSYAAAITFPSNVSPAADTAVAVSGIGRTLTATSISVALTSPTSASNLSYGIPLTITMTFSFPAGSTDPSGAIAVLVNGTQATSIPIVSGTTVYTYIFTPNAGAIAVTTSYSGDSNFSSSNSTLNLQINPAPTATALTLVSNLSATVPEVTLTAQVTSAIPGVQGAVTFYNGTTVLATVSLATTTGSSMLSASFAQTSLGLTNTSFTAVYNGTTNFATSTSTAQILNGDFGLTPSLSVSTPQGGIALGSFIVTPYFGLNGTMQFSCSGLPTASLCRVYPQTLSFSGMENTAATQQLQVFTNVSTTTASLKPHGDPFGRGPATTLFAGMFSLFLLKRRRVSSLLSIILLAIVAGLSGCGKSGGTSTANVTPTGTYNVTLTATSSTGVIHTSALTLIVAAPE